jgi:GntR family transcriptional repressor for pyruvate dehydrogenase complex
MNSFAGLTRGNILASEIEKQILEREYKPGELIGTIEDLKSRSGFARSTVGEAVRLLTDRGLAEIRPGRGGGLYATAAGPVVHIRQSLLTVTSTPVSVAEAVAVRDALQELIAADAAAHRSAADMTELKKLLVKLTNAVGRKDAEFLIVEQDLHERIALISPNETAKALYLSMNRFIREHGAVNVGGDEPSWLSADVDLVGAILAGDVQKTKVALKTHVAATVEAS